MTRETTPWSFPFARRASPQTRRRSLGSGLPLVVIALLATPTLAQEETPAPPTNVQVADHPNDIGRSLDVAWTRSVDDTTTPDTIVTGYRILRKDAQVPDSDFGLVGEVTAGTESYVDPAALRGRPYLYQVVAVGRDDALSPGAASFEPVAARMQWFDRSKTGFLVVTIAICGSVLFFIFLASRGRELKIRKIAGLEAVEEAVGRATEMGKDCMFVPGIQDVDQLDTVAGITILGRVAEVVATYDATLSVPTARSLAMTAARETVSTAYMVAGRHEAYNEDDVYYVTDEQFGFVAAVTGYMKREKPAACFYFGQFYAESLILAETGNSIGAMQVAGTAQPSQLPFFVAACDYTLIGEEFFAASAYLSGEPHQLGSLKGQDVGKLIVAALLLTGCALATLIEFWPDNELFRRLLDFLIQNVLTVT